MVIAIILHTIVTIETPLATIAIIVTIAIATIETLLVIIATITMATIAMAIIATTTPLITNNEEDTKSNFSLFSLALPPDGGFFIFLTGL